GEQGAPGPQGEGGPMGPQGPPGPPGERGPEPSFAEIMAAVAAFFDANDFQCVPNLDPPGTFTCSFTL
ncbi:MAG: hypothetical protein ACREMB_21180, partial [Candidatus Rokuibacteriota bacterium]